MINDFPEFERLVDSFGSLPGISSRAAKKIAYHLLQQDSKYISHFINSIRQAVEVLKPCQNCFLLNPLEVCVMCSNKERDFSKLCIISAPESRTSIENSNAFRGLYLMIESEIKLKTPVTAHRIGIERILQRIEKGNFKEVVICTSPTPEGEATAIYINRTIKDNFSDIEVTRLAFGLPMNSSIEYADQFTMAKSLQNRTKM